MKAVILTDAYKVEVQDVPKPELTDDQQVLIEVHYTGLCDLHHYRGLDDGRDYIMGHEVLGAVVEVGKGIKKFQKGDLVVSPFSASCGECWYCQKSYTARCPHGTVYGSPTTPGCQAEYFVQPLADGCLFKVPDELRQHGFPLEVLLLLADVLPTGYSAAFNARRLLDEDREEPTAMQVKEGVALVIGCGPVGLCAITSATTLFSTVLAVDPNPARRQLAEKHGAKAFAPEDIAQAVRDATDGRGADATLEVVGHQNALDLAIELVRPHGAVSSVGVHTGDRTMSGDTLYGKNIRFQFGRCSVRRHFPAAIAILKDKSDLFKNFVEHVVGFDEAVDYYKRFEKNEVGKTVFITEAGRAARGGE